MSDPTQPMNERAEFLGLLPAYMNGLLDEADSQRMKQALQQHPEWQHDVAFDQLLSEAMLSHQPKLSQQEAWLMFKRRLEQEGLLNTRQHDN